MYLVRVIIFSLLLISPAKAQEYQWFCNSENDIRYINTALGKQKIMIFEPEERDAEELIFFFHGDSAFGPPSYQYDMARRIVGHREGAMAVAVLRPGYEDGCGDSSEGDVGYKMGDNYTLEVVNALAEVISAVQSEYPLKTTLFGHSGGAAISAIIMNRHPDLASTALLAACPCDLKAWRQHMYERTGNERWLSDLPGLSPVNELANLSGHARFHLVVGTDDQITPLSMTSKYSNSLDSKEILNSEIIFARDPHRVMQNTPIGHDAIITDMYLKAFLDSY